LGCAVSGAVTVVAGLSAGKCGKARRRTAGWTVSRPILSRQVHPGRFSGAIDDRLKASNGASRTAIGQKGGYPSNTLRGTLNHPDPLRGDGGHVSQPDEPGKQTGRHDARDPVLFPVEWHRAA